MTPSPEDLASEARPDKPPAEPTTELPPEPTSVEATGLSGALLQQLVAKALYVRGELTEASAAQLLKLPYAITQELLTDLCRDKYCEKKGPANRTGLLFRYALTAEGFARAQEYMASSAYVGPAPVPLARFEAMVHRQSALRLVVQRPLLEAALRHLVLPSELTEQLGGAVNSGAPILLYGEPGNGKTVIAEALGAMLSGEGGRTILLPYALVVDEQIIELFDPAIHVAVDPAGANGDGAEGVGRTPPGDARWVRCRRPTVFTGGELTLAMLDLCFNPIAKYYAAPPQVKASGGVFIIDDFGRQAVPPETLLNRWIVPLETRVDYLTLHTGKKLRVPFDTLVVLCTNMAPQKLADEAFLRRMANKIHVGDPTVAAYTEIFQRTCKKYGIPFEVQAVEYLYHQYYTKHGIRPRSCHPRDLLKQVVSFGKFAGIPPALGPGVLDRACRNYLLFGAEPSPAPPPVTIKSVAGPRGANGRARDHLRPGAMP